MQTSHLRCPTRSMAYRVFKSFQCSPLELISGDDSDPPVVRRYLVDDLRVTCNDRDEYAEIRLDAIILIGIWPLGGGKRRSNLRILKICPIRVVLEPHFDSPGCAVPCLYAALLRANWKNIREGRSTPFTRATAFLYTDYKPRTSYWEPLEMLRKLTLNGAVLLLPESLFLGRVLIAAMVSMTYLSLQVFIQPYKNPEDNFIALAIHLALSLVYLAVRLLVICVLSDKACWNPRVTDTGAPALLRSRNSVTKLALSSTLCLLQVMLLKTCEASEAICAALGLGSTGAGVFIFFVVFGVCMLVLLFSLGVGNLYFSAR
eukprot:4437966-Prymnesium_polylepis.3